MIAADRAQELQQLVDFVKEKLAAMYDTPLSRVHVSGHVFVSREVFDATDGESTVISTHLHKTLASSRGDNIWMYTEQLNADS